MHFAARAPSLFALSPVLGLVVMLGGGCKKVKRPKPKTRVLGEVKAAGARFTVTGRLLSSRMSTHTTGGRIVRGSDSSRLVLLVEARQGGKKLALYRVPRRQPIRFRSFRSWAKGKRALAALEVEICAQGDRLLWRLKGPNADDMSIWELVYLRSGYGVRTVATPAGATPAVVTPAESNPAGSTSAQKGRSASCKQVLHRALRWKAWRKLHASRGKLCQRLQKEQHHLAAARCMLRDPGSGLDGVDVRTPQMQRAVLRALAPDPRWDAQQWNETAIGVTLRRLDPPDVRELIEKTVAHCSREGVNCAAWRLGGMARAARRLGPKACPSLLRLAVRRLGQPGADNAMAALVILRQIFRHVDQRKLAPILRAGLGRATTPDLKLERRGAIAYSGGSLCGDHELRITFRSRRGYSRCESLSRFAGSWLGLHCSPEAVKAGLAAAKRAGKADLDPRTSQVLDGALRVLGWCDPKAFEQAIANAPEDAPTKAVADSRGKKNLRRIFLHPVKP